MGYCLTCKCHKCGYSSSSHFGSGKYSTEFLTPAYNTTTNTVDECTLSSLSPSTIPYYEKKLKKRKYIFKPKCIIWWNYQINEKSNYCPNCKKFALNFVISSFFD